MLKRLNFFDENENLKNVDLEMIAKFFPEAVTFNSLTAEVITNCTTRANLPDPRLMSEQPPCDRKAIMLVSCLAAHMTSNCPEEKQDLSQRCIEKRFLIGKAKENPDFEVDQKIDA